MKIGSTMFLRAVIYIIGIAVLTICLIGLPRLITLEFSGDFDYGWLLIGLYIPAVPFFFALLQALKLLSYIDRNQAFTEASVQAFRIIKNCALLVSLLFTAGLPYIFHLADKDDAPGLVALGIVIAGASFVIATFAALLQKLIQNAVDIKAENDLTV